MNERLRRVKAEMERQGIDAYLIETRENKFALSGFDHHISDYSTISLLLLTKGKDYFLVERMEREAAEGGAKGCEIVTPEPGERAGVLIKRIAETEGGFKTIGYETNAFRKCYFEEIKEHIPGAEFLPVDLAEQARILKTDEEIAHIAEAMAIGSKALRKGAEHIAVGVTEKEIAWELEAAARKLFGADDLSFPVIVASGANSSKPHHVPTDRKLKRGDFVLIDFGVRFRAYCSDITRTYFLGEASERQREIYYTVLRALEAAEAAARPGMSGKELDEIARNVITEAGYGEQFPHSLGHGVGLEIHEDPRISTRSETSLQPNMVFTIEPGVYIPGFGGVRIEDSLVLEAGGVRVLTDPSRELTIL